MPPQHATSYRTIPQASITFRKLPQNIPQYNGQLKKLLQLSTCYRYTPQATNPFHKQPHHSARLHYIPQATATCTRSKTTGADMIQQNLCQTTSSTITIFWFPEHTFPNRVVLTIELKAQA